jgi:hypothetical protein
MANQLGEDWGESWGERKGKELDQPLERVWGAQLGTVWAKVREPQKAQVKEAWWGVVTATLLERQMDCGLVLRTAQEKGKVLVQQLAPRLAMLLEGVKA